MLYKCVAGLQTYTNMSSPLCGYEHHYQNVLFHEKRKTQHLKQFDASNDLNVKSNLILEMEQDRILIKESQTSLCCGFFSQEKHKMFREQNKGIWTSKQLEIKLSTSEDIALARQSKAKNITQCDKKSKRPISTMETESETQRVNKHKSRVSNRAK